MSNKKRCTLGESNAGFSLIEVVVAIGVLAVVATSILSYFSQSSKYNAKARMTQKATLATQKVTEDIFSYEDLPAMAYSYVYTQASNGWQAVNSDNPLTCAMEPGIVTAASSPALTGGNNRKYYFKRPVEVDGTEFMAMITVDPTVYTGAGAKKSYANSHLNSTTISVPGLHPNVLYNDLGIPELRSIYTDRNVVAVQSDEDDMGISNLGQNTNFATTAQKENHIRSLIPSGVTNREINITLRYATKVTGPGTYDVDYDFVTAVIQFIYHSKDEHGNDIEATINVMEDEYAVDDLQNIYLFFQNFCPFYNPATNATKDKITFEIAGAYGGETASISNLVSKLHNRLSFYFIVTRNPNFTSDSNFEEYEIPFSISSSIASVVKKDTASGHETQSMVVSNAPKSVVCAGSGLQPTNRDVMSTRVYQKSSSLGGGTLDVSDGHTGILVAADQALIADVTVDLYDKEGNEKLQTYQTGKGE